MMIYATDLDRTVIFSDKFIDESVKDAVCIERKGDKEISYMRKSALMKLDNLKKKKNLTIVPITTRSVEQFGRVKPFTNLEYAITTNGGYILHNGEPLKEWQEKIEKILRRYCNSFEDIVKYLNGYSDIFRIGPKIVDNVFVFAVLKEGVEEQTDALLQNLKEFLDHTKWNFTLQGYKLYVIPKPISKENALKYLKKYLGEDVMVVSGDGKLDLNFLKLGDMRIIPEDSEVLENINISYCTVTKGLNGTNELFSLVEQISN